MPLRKRQKIQAVPWAQCIALAPGAMHRPSRPAQCIDPFTRRYAWRFALHRRKRSVQTARTALLCARIAPCLFTGGALAQKKTLPQKGQHFFTDAVRPKSPHHNAGARPKDKAGFAERGVYPFRANQYSSAGAAFFFWRASFDSSPSSAPKTTLYGSRAASMYSSVSLARSSCACALVK